MKKNHFIARKGLFSLALAAVGAMFLGSCAVDGFDDKEKIRMKKMLIRINDNLKARL